MNNLLLVGFVFTIMIIYYRKTFIIKTFSNTQSWDKDLSDQIMNDLQVDKLTKISIIPPLDNNSYKRKKEIKYICYLQKLYNTEENKQKTILEKKLTHTIEYIDDKTILNSSQYNNLYYFIKYSLNPLIISIKNYFDTVRPSFLGSCVNETLFLEGNPGHPSYPSGHSFQSHFIAYLLINYVNVIDHPEKSKLIKQYLQRANDVSVRREIAGVHYKSDTNYGKLLALEISDILFNETIDVLNDKIYIHNKKWEQILS